MATTTTPTPPSEALAATKTPTAPRKQKLSKRRRREALSFYLFVSPWAIGFLVFLLGPMIASIYYSMTDWDSFTSPHWVGFQNYTKLLTDDPVFWKALWNTLYYAAISVPLGLVLGLWLANLLNKQIRARKLFRTLIYLPTLIPLVATAMIFRMVLAPNGPINDFLGLFGVSGPNWLFDGPWVKPALILMSAWGAGAATVLLLAAMKGIPRELYEAAEVDGASATRQFWSITLPHLTPIIFFNLIMGLIGAFQVFSQVYILVAKGKNPAGYDAAQTMVPFLFDQAFNYYHMGYASAISWLLFLVILVFTVIAFRTTRRWVFYETEVK
ncbi:carbohydrate ABC transporter permease [Streptomyces acidiscabies]|uniref:Sugar ABC transporter permease n=1 Tax=Streptomyces acidiscabies TaxID=42234 RepID=A0AAP6EH72_9ACTN|nr:sugar ABC transporter permease [Streptomyces acidiscabies]MBP5935816.1 sugar ABC transporter permease [Streptomyces sp. LBUM 1476]MBZ3916280.1 sugar ABC transporter permease [Streptomyces acidiscabies]MDX2962046.1 sugar ABC transporter permease [Streptomyces acidiscabies]MDX3017957.1 sugar ABC transporter permease [Streptomyces acidiscabies]MDX3791270.1 sugar ABC transporter permease [Streptomyces acidiscabies]